MLLTQAVKRCVIASTAPLTCFLERPGRWGCPSPYRYQPQASTHLPGDETQISPFQPKCLKLALGHYLETVECLGKSQDCTVLWQMSVPSCPPGKTLDFKLKVAAAARQAQPWPWQLSDTHLYQVWSSLKGLCKLGP